jgi:putative copper export protein
MIIAYWVFLSGAIFLTGSYLSKIIIALPSGVDMCVPQGKNKCCGESAALVIFLLSLITLAANIAHLVLHASFMTESPLSEVFSILPIFITKTKYGIFSFYRIVLLVVIVFISFYALKRNDKLANISGVIFSLILVITLTMSGHQGTKGYLNIPFFLDNLHIIAISYWIGGLMFIRLCYSYFLTAADISLWSPCLRLINKFSQSATISVLIVGLTGLLLFYNNYGNANVTITGWYRPVLVFKTMLAILLITLGGINKFFILPRINRIESGEWSELAQTRGRLNNFMTAEIIIALGILLSTSLLTHLSPGV